MVTSSHRQLKSESFPGNRLYIGHSTVNWNRAVTMVHTSFRSGQYQNKVVYTAIAPQTLQQGILGGKLSRTTACHGAKHDVRKMIVDDATELEK